MVKNRSGRLVWIGIIIITLAAAYLIDPAGRMPVNCLFHRYTGLSCPTCGLSRSVHETVHLQIAGALHHHWMGPVLVIIACLLLVKLVVEWVTGRTVTIPLSRSALWGIIALFLLIWLAFFLIRLSGELTA